MKKKRKQKRPTKKQKKFSLVRWVFKWAVVIAIWVAVILAVVVAYYAHDLPQVDAIFKDDKGKRITLLAADGTVITSFGDIYNEIVTYDQLPQHLIDAVISTEDRRFFYHFGIDPIGLLRAAYVNYKAGRVVQGGSTITQQLVKNVFLTPERTIKRKIQEMLLAFYVEHQFTKERILEMYLNRIYMGGGYYGVGAATRGYFDKSVEQLSIYQSAMLAGLIKAPSRFAPTSYLARAQERADQVMMLMVETNALTTEQLVDETFGLHSYVVPSKQTKKRQYFVDWIKDQLADYAGGINTDLIVRTTLDPVVQAHATAILQETIEKNGKEHDVSQGAVVVMSPKGKLLAMVGGVSYAQSQFNRVTSAYRQSGSAFKLFVYLAALQAGLTPSDKMTDEPINIAGWQPENWSHRYQGNVSLRQALSESINTIAVKLGKQLGMKAISDIAYTLGVTATINNDLSSVLGTSEMSLLELTTAYAHMPNGGHAVWVHGIESIETLDGRIVYERTEPSKLPVISAKMVAQMNDMLTETLKTGTGKKAQLAWDAAGKTGTSQNFRDAWFIGYTGDYVAGIWLGNDDNTPMKRVGGGGFPALIWKNLMQAVHGEERSSLPVTEYGVRHGKDEPSIWQSILSTFGSAPDVEHRYPNSR